MEHTPTKTKMLFLAVNLNQSIVFASEMRCVRQSKKISIKDLFLKDLRHKWGKGEGTVPIARREESLNGRIERALNNRNNSFISTDNVRLINI